MMHLLSLLEASPYASGCFICNLCWEKGCGPVYHCSDCDFDVHATCAATAKQQTHFSHFQHPLYLCLCSINRVCDGCGENIDKWAFRCETCDVDMHSLCVRAPRYILHPAHVHPLSLTKASDHRGTCDACNQSTMDLFYHCQTCDYSLHQSCATLPAQVKHSSHPQHMLRLQCLPTKEETTFICAQCGEQGNTWRFQCTSCQIFVHPHCARILHELPHSDLSASLQESVSNTSITPTSVLMSENVSGSLTLTADDLKGAEKVLSFAQEIIRKSASTAITLSSADASISDEQDTCPTCLEGYLPSNPKRSTSCGHHFHLPCILSWLERCTRCPICRKNVNIRM